MQDQNIMKHIVFSKDCSLIEHVEHNDSLQSQLGASPVSPLGVVTDGVASTHPEDEENVEIYLYLEI